MPVNRLFTSTSTHIKSVLVLLLFAIGVSASAQEIKGSWEKITVHSKALEGNLEGNSPDRTVFVYLPPSYKTDASKRYPVLYNLHGYTVTAQMWGGFLKWPGELDKAFVDGGNREMIVVMPDAMTVHAGSMYSSSVTTGFWERFVTEDLVAYIDANYRTIAKRESRGLAGHSMGGYGAVRLGMKYPQVYSVMYALSACCMAPRTYNEGFGGQSTTNIEDVKTVEQAKAAGMGIRSTLAVSSAWAPNPHNPPLYLDLPVKDGKVQDLVIAKWAANAPLVMVHQYVPNLREYNAIGLEIGLQDGGLKDSQALDKILTDYHIDHTFETYEGTHTSKIAERYVSKVIPFFSKHLAFK